MKPSAISHSVRRSHLGALRLAVEVLEGSSLRVGGHITAVCDALDRVIEGESNRLIINIPPGYGKTLNAVWTFCARGFVINPMARFIHTSYSAELALDNSSKIKEILESEAFQYFNPMDIRVDTKAKGLWRTDAGGGMRAAAAGSGITGFRAGQMTDDEEEYKFSGAIVIDDPLKPDDARSKTKTKVQNERYNNSVASRLAHESVPIIVIMQRLVSFSSDKGDSKLSECGDLSEFLLRGGSGEEWDHLLLPIEVDSGAKYPEEWTHGNVINHNLPDGPLWKYKHSSDDIARLRRADQYVFAAQYGQRPKKRLGDSLIDGKWFQRYSSNALPVFKNIEIFVDTANKKKESADYTVFLAAGLTHDNKLYVLDVLRKKWTIPELYKVGIDFWNKWKAQGATKINIEDKMSGTFLIQSMFETIKHSVVAVPRDIDKFTRVNGVLERISSGHVYLPNDSAWVSDFINECEEFTDDDSHDYDDQVDAMCDAIEKLVRTTPAKTDQVFNVGFM